MQDVTKSTWDSTVKSQPLVLADFYTPSCGPCRQMLPILSEVSANLDGKTVLVKVNCADEENIPIAVDLGVNRVPTFVLFKNGVEVARQSGLVAAGELTTWVESYAN